MGLIKAALGSAGGVLAGQWKEFFYCDALPADVLVTKGQKRASGRSSNTRGSGNIITNDSVIAEADGQCMLIVEQGKVVDVCAEPGEYTYDTSTETSLDYLTVTRRGSDVTFRWNDTPQGAALLEACGYPDDIPCGQEMTVHGLYGDYTQVFCGAMGEPGAP